MMTVQELIDELSQLDPDEEIFLNLSGWVAEINSVGKTEVGIETHTTINS